MADQPTRCRSKPWSALMALPVAVLLAVSATTARAQPRDGEGNPVELDAFANQFQGMVSVPAAPLSPWP